MVVQKFGGTSVADVDAITRLIAIVRTARARDGRGPAVVVSAMSGVTDALLRLAGDAAAGHQHEARAHRRHRLGQERYGARVFPAGDDDVSRIDPCTGKTCLSQRGGDDARGEQLTGGRHQIERSR